jgi:hypothetical protein
MASAKRPQGRKKRFNGKGLMALRLAFAHKFGRFPAGQDPVFFDPDADQPHSLPADGMQRLILEAMLEHGTAAHLVYAYCRTGFPVSDRSMLPPERLLRWDKAIGEWLAFKDKLNHVQH